MDYLKHNSNYQDCVEILRLRASHIINAKMQFEMKMKKALEKYPDNQELVVIQDVFSEVFCAKKINDPTRTENENSKMQVQEDIRTPEAQNMSNPVDDFELDPKVLEHMEIIEYLHSEQGKKDMAEMFPAQQKSSERRNSDLFIPSFSLGPEIETEYQVAEDINKEHETALHHDEYVTPKPLMREKSKRQIKVGQYGKSPYIERVIDLNGRYTDEDIMLWRYMSLTSRNNL